MKRDMDLIRKIMLRVEVSNGAQADISPLLGEGFNESELSYHATLIYRAGLAEGMYVEGGLDPGETGFALLSNLTWSGHDFIEAARNDTLWEKAKAKVKGTIGGLVTESLKVALAFYANEAMTKGLAGG